MVEIRIDGKLKAERFHIADLIRRRDKELRRLVELKVIREQASKGCGRNDCPLLVYCRWDNLCKHIVEAAQELEVKDE